MNRKGIAGTWAALLILTRTADAAVTLHFSPDLAHEANPIVSVLGQGWSALLVLQVLGVGLILACTASWCLHPLRYELPVPDEGVWAFASQCYFGRVYPAWEFLGRQMVQRPARWKHFAQLCGFVAPPLTSLLGILAVLAWLGMANESMSWWFALYSETPLGLRLAALLLVIYTFQAIFYGLEYRAARALRRQ